jgi:peptidoglycan/xylan/chitin deacetylase (PgdA/CDA1 family)
VQSASFLFDNAPWTFWRLARAAIGEDVWIAAAQAARTCLHGLPAVDSPDDPLQAIAAILTEGQFGPDHFYLSPIKRWYYAVRPVLPTRVRPLLHRLAGPGQRRKHMLGWPIEERYVQFQYQIVRQVATSLGLQAVPYLHFWPNGLRFALVLTHDIESKTGQSFVREVVELEENYGFRSSFNFVAEDYVIDNELAAELNERGFEVGLHGLRHDGKSFVSRETFQLRAARINRHLVERRMTGFRSPMTHRNPEWMQALNVEYDSSFFDTDPFEPMPGGTMSIWPFFMGAFVELPYTLAQDHTLVETAGESTPRLWLDKIAFISRYCGMALVNTHPDYLQSPRYWAVYEEFLRNLSERADYWHALPRQAARWWRARTMADVVETADGWAAPALPGACIGTILTDGGSVWVDRGPKQVESLA